MACLHLFSTVDESLLLRGYPFFLLHSFFDPFHLQKQIKADIPDINSHRSLKKKQWFAKGIA